MKKPWTRDEKLLLLTPLLLVAGLGVIWLWRQRAVPSIELPKDSFVRALEFSPDGKKLAVFYSDNTFAKDYREVYDLSTREKVCDLATPPWPVTAPNPRFSTQKPSFASPSWSPDGTRIVAAYHDSSLGTTLIPNFSTAPNRPRMIYNNVGKIALWDAKRGILQGNWLYAPPSVDSRSAVRFSRDGKTLIGSGIPPATFNATTGQRFPVSRKDTPEGELGVTVVRDTALKQFRVIDAQTKRILWSPEVNWKMSGAPRHRWLGEIVAIRDIVEVSNGRYLQTRWQLWNARTRTPLALPLKPNQLVENLKMSSDEKTLAFFSFKFEPAPLDEPAKITGELVLWDYGQNRVVKKIPAQSRWDWLQWSPDDKWVSIVADSTSTTARRVLVFDRSGQLRWEQPCRSTINRWSPDSSRIVYFAQKDKKNFLEFLRVSD